MEETGILRKTLYYKKQEEKGYGAETDEKDAEAPGNEELLTLLCQFHPAHNVKGSTI